MMELKPEDSIHKSYLNRLLIEIGDQTELSQSMAFKGGTCASMLGFLDRFSVDLDFDLLRSLPQLTIRQGLLRIFDHLGLSVEREFDQVLMFQVKYPSDPNRRSTIKLSLNTIITKANQYKVQYFSEIDRLLNSQTIETMFANKLVATLDRYQHHGSIAGRDIYDIHHFFLSGYSYIGQVITERTGDDPNTYLSKLIEFIKNKVNQNIINEDLNLLLSSQQFQSIRKILIPETINFLTNETDNMSRMI